MGAALFHCSVHRKQDESWVPLGSAVLLERCDLAPAEVLVLWYYRFVLWVRGKCRTGGGSNLRVLWVRRKCRTTSTSKY